MTLNVTDAHPNKKVAIRTSEPESVMELLTTYLSTQQIHGLEVRKQTLEDVYVSIIQGEDIE